MRGPADPRRGRHGFPRLPDMTLFAIAVLVPALLALALFALARTAGRRGRPLASGCCALLSLCCVLCTVIVVVAGLALLSWTRLTHESHAADLAFTRVAERSYDVDVAFADGRHETLRLSGDEWQVDARVIKWMPFANLLGFDTVYRLERLSGRYRDVDDERTQPRTVHRLHDADAVDVWSLVRVAGSRLPWVDARYGSAVYLPMRDGATFTVTVGQAGLVARPANEAARDAVAGWH